MNINNYNKLHIGIFGDINVGKSSLFNKLTDSTLSIASGNNETTKFSLKKSVVFTDAINAVFFDTMGFKDLNNMENRKIINTLEILEKIDFALFLIDSNNIDYTSFNLMKEEFDTLKIPYHVVFTKNDNNENIVTSLSDYSSISIYDEISIENLKSAISNKLLEFKEEEIDLMEGLLEKNSNVLLVIPDDLNLVENQLISPQSQIIKSCLKNDILCILTTKSMLESTLSKLDKIDLVITDSLIFNEIDNIIEKEVPLTTFSIIMSRQKGDIKTFTNCINALDTIKNGDYILIAEVCSQNKAHKDLGNVKIPFLIRNKTQKDLNFDFVKGNDYPKDLSKYKLVIHCGGCMITKTQMNRLINRHNNITNYGTVIAYCTNILPRAIKSLK